MSWKFSMERYSCYKKYQTLACIIKFVKIDKVYGFFLTLYPIKMCFCLLFVCLGSRTIIIIHIKVKKICSHKSIWIKLYTSTKTVVIMILWWSKSFDYKALNQNNFFGKIKKKPKYVWLPLAFFSVCNSFTGFTKKRELFAKFRLISWIFL